jgi:hypothetical protein
VLFSIFSFTVIQAEAAGTGRRAVRELGKIMTTATVGTGFYNLVVEPIAHNVLNPPTSGTTMTIQSGNHMIKCRNPSVRYGYAG